LERVLEKAEADGVNLPEDRRTVQDNLDAADAMSGADAYDGIALDIGSDLLNDTDTPTVKLDLAAAIRKAVEHNLDLAVARLNPQISAEQITQAESVFDTVVFAGGDWAELDTPRPPGAIPGLSGDQQSENLQLRTGIRQAFDSGAQLVAQAQVDRSWSSPSFFGVNRFYDADVLVQLTQPLLRGYGDDVNRANIELAGIAQQADVVALRQTMIDLAVAVEQAYWQLVSARRSLLIQQRLLERTIAMRDKLEPRFGFDLLLADLNEVNARVDQRRADVIRSRELVRSLSDRLKRLINDPDLPVIGEAVIDPSDTPADAAISFSLLDQVTTALQHRT
ncbi:MAG: TolC family protein, partial [Pirellulales bacterium]|nr:TolC family protein [Pirellulales bacterium]